MCVMLWFQKIESGKGFEKSGGENILSLARVLTWRHKVVFICSN